MSGKILCVDDEANVLAAGNFRGSLKADPGCETDLRRIGSRVWSFDIRNRPCRQPVRSGGHADPRTYALSAHNWFSRNQNRIGNGAYGEYPMPRDQGNEWGCG